MPSGYSSMFYVHDTVHNEQCYERHIFMGRNIFHNLQVYKTRISVKKL